MGSTSQEAEDASLTEQSDIRFIPPLYEQRYQEIIRIARECQPKKVVDIGCGELKVIRLLKFHQYIHELIALDTDEEILKQHSYLINPLAASYINPLLHPFVITLLHGSIVERDSRLLNCDLAVCVEVIEHLYPDDLTEATKVIFGYMKPKRAVFTTPNAEFNVLFPRMQGFRHDDHKFEWTRSEFQEWGNTACSVYGYTVEYSGLGTGPEGSEHLGFCTQMAIFDIISTDRDRPVEPTEEDLEPMPYIEVARAVYHSKQLSDEDVVAEAELRVRQLLKDAGRMLDEEEGVFDNAFQEEDDDTIRTWMTQSLAARARDREGTRERQCCEREGEGGSELSAERHSCVLRTAAENGCSDCIPSAMEGTKDTLQSTSVCYSGKVLNVADHENKTEENLHDSPSYSCQISHEPCRNIVSDLPNVLDAVSSLHLRDTELLAHLDDSACPEGPSTVHNSSCIISKVEPQCKGSSDAKNFATGNVLDFEECAYVLGLQSKCFSFSDVEDGCSFYEQWEKGFPHREFSFDLEELKISISLERLMKFPTLQEMCPDVNKLREVLLASGKFQFNSNGNAVIADLYEDSSDSEKWEAGSDGDWDSDAQTQLEIEDGKSLDIDDIMMDEECWG